MGWPCWDDYVSFSGRQGGLDALCVRADANDAVADVQEMELAEASSDDLPF